MKVFVLSVLYLYYNNMSASKNNLNEELLVENVDKVESPGKTATKLETPESKTVPNCNAPQRVVNRRINHARLIIPTIAFPSLNPFQVNDGSSESNSSGEANSVMFTTPDPKPKTNGPFVWK